VTEQRPPVDFDAQKAADRVAELIAEGSMLARGWAERFARRQQDSTSAARTDPGAQPDPTPSDPSASSASSASSDPGPEKPPVGEDAWSLECDPVSTSDAPVVGDAVPTVATEAAEAGEARERDAGDEVEALTESLRATVAHRLGIPSNRVRITVTLDDAPTDAGSVAASPVVAAPATSDFVAGVIVPTPITDRDPIDALTATLVELAARARTRLADELGVRLPDIVAEIRFPAGGRPSVRIRPSARASTGQPNNAGPAGGASIPDLEALLRRLLLGRDGR